MLNPKLIPTPLVQREERERLPIAAPRRERGRSLKIMRAFGGWLLWAIWTKLIGRWTPETNALRLRGVLERLGFLWIKVGQVLSLRTDLFSDVLCNELAQLQYKAFGFPPEMAREIIERELGAPVENFFSEYDEYPFAAASISQVHMATVKEDGARVVIKVMRPNAARLFQADLKFISRVLALFGLHPTLKRMHLEEAVWELQQIVNEEVDYRFEVSNIERFRKNVRKHKIYVPRPFRKLSTARILVMEWIDGVMMSEYIRVGFLDPEKQAAWRQENNFKPKDVARRLLFSFLRQLFEDNLFHGDLHPGNIMLLRDGRVALIDLGSLGTAEATLLRRYRFGMQAIVDGDYQKASDLMLTFFPQLPVIDLVPVREDMVRALREWEMRTHVKELPYHKKSITAMFVAFAESMAKQGAFATWGFMKIDRTFSTLDASLSDLYPEVNYPKTMRRYYRTAKRRALRKMFRVHTVANLLVGVPNQLQEYQTLLDPLIRQAGTSFEAGLSKVATIVRFFLGIGYRTVMLAGIYVFLTFLHQHHGFLTGEYDGFLAFVQRWLDKFPALPYWEWVALVALDMLLLVPMLRLYRGVGTPEIRLPATTNTK